MQPQQSHITENIYSLMNTLLFPREVSNCYKTYRHMSRISAFTKAFIFQKRVGNKQNRLRKIIIAL